MRTDAKTSVLQFAQDCIGKSPVIILGSGASAAYGIPGMPQLKAHLLGIKCPATVKPEDAAKWAEFQTKLKTTDLESALDEVRLPQNLTALVVESTWDYLAPYDHRVFERAIIDHSLFPLTRLFAHLFQDQSPSLRCGWKRANNHKNLRGVFCPWLERHQIMTVSREGCEVCEGRGRVVFASFVSFARNRLYPH